MDMEALQHFKRVAELEHMTRAAEELYISQPSLSASIQRLEHELGVSLFERKGRNMALNDYGKIFLKYAISILSDFSRAKQEIQARHDREYNTLKVSSCTLFQFPGLLDRILQSYPNIRLTYVNGSKHVLQQMLENGQLEFCILPYEFDPPVKSVLLEDSEMVVVVAKDHPLTRKEFPSLLDFSKERFAVYTNDHPLHPWMDQLFEASGIQAMRAEISKGQKDLLLAARTGRYAALVPMSSLKNITDSGLAVFHLDNPLLRWKYVYSSCETPNRRPIVKDVENMILRYFEEKERSAP